MKTERISVSNVKCSGCINSIVKGISQIQGVINVTFHHDDNTVIVDHVEDLKRQTLVIKLKELGYPEAN